MTTMRAWAVLVVASAAAIFACGPSFQVIYEGDARFEHCYALDDDPQLAMQTKAACWQDWVKNYRYGQTRNRVDYANLRYHALSRGNSMPTDDALMGAAPGEAPGATGVSAPAPTNAFAPPPKTLAEDAGVPPAPEASGVVTIPAPAPTPPDKTGKKDLVLPKSGCADRCADTWQGCKGACAGAAGACAICDKTYGRCMKGCF